MDLLFPLLILFMIGMIFFSNRQRKKQQAQQEEMQNAISVGDVVLLTSGLSGTVVDTDDEKTLDIEIAPDVITTWLRAAVREKLSSDADGVTGTDTTDEVTPDDPRDEEPAPATSGGVQLSKGDAPVNGVADATPARYSDATAEPRSS